MPLSFTNVQRAPSDVAEAADIDVTPIMNMFIILIPFLVSMAVFTHLAIIEFSLPPNVGAGLDSSQGKPKLKITVVLAEEYVAITHGDKMLDSIPSFEGRYNIDSLLTSLKAHREEVEIQNEVIVAIHDAIRFKHVVKIMDICRETGFEKIGLSSATEDTGKV